MGFSDELRRRAAPLWDAEKRHPFIVGLGDGTLPVEAFRYYMRQDYVFLVESCRVIALAVAKCDDLEDMAWFAGLLDDTLNVEMQLHVGFCGDFGIAEAELRATPPSPTTTAYTAHLTRVASLGTAGETGAAMLPCWWGYAEIGQALAGGGAGGDQPLYARWIAMYASDEFAALASRLRSFVDRAAEGVGAEALGRMERAFLTSSRHEYMFWDAAYRLEAWPV